MSDAYRVLPADAGAPPGSSVGQVRRRPGRRPSPDPPRPTGVSPDLMIIALPAVRALSGFTSSWGLEFEPRSLPVDEPVVWEVTSGRSSNGALPWLAAETDTGVVVITVHWSGNWRFVITPGSDGTQIAVGLHPDGQRVILAAGRTSSGCPRSASRSARPPPTPSAALATLLSGQVPPSAAGLLTEWNHWWPYEDAEIDEATFLAEASVAADLGLEVAVLDAGWFGRRRGEQRLGGRAGRLAPGQHRPVPARAGLAGRGDPPARDRLRHLDRGRGHRPGRDGQRRAPRDRGPDRRRRRSATSAWAPPAGQHARARPRRSADRPRPGPAGSSGTSTSIPAPGCRRDDHGHAADDGLLRHYLGLYAVLDRLRAAHPDTIFEACSSGGLRIDAGLAAHVDGFFLSDPDWTEHHLTCLWGAARLLPPRQLLHWPQSEWRGEHRFQKVDYSGTLITADPVRHQDQSRDAAPLRHLDPADPAARRPARAAPPPPAGLRAVRPTAAGRRHPATPDGPAAARGEGAPAAGVPADLG